MRNFQEKRKGRNVVRPLYISFFLAIIFLFFSWGIWGFTGKMLETLKNRKIAENKLTELRQEKEKFSANIAKLKTEEGVEETIRDKFGWAKEGEGMIVVVDEEDIKEVEKDTKYQGFVSFFKNLFK